MNYPEWTIVRGISLLAEKIFKPMEYIMMTKFGTDTSTVLFYGDVNEEVAKEASLNNLRFIWNVIGNSNKTINLCVPNFVSNSLAKCLIKAQQTKKVTIQVAIHNSTNLDNVQQLLHNDIAVKVINSSRLEHEFVLVDAIDDFEGAAALINSINYEMINFNRDNTIFISEKSVVRGLKKEFDRVWQSVPHLISDKNVLPKLND